MAAGDPEVLRLLLQDKYRFLEPDDYPSERELAWEAPGSVHVDDQAYRRAQEADEAWLRKVEIEQMAYEQEVAERLAILSRRYPQATPHELLSMPGVL